MFKSCIGAVDEIDRLPELMGWFDNFRGEPTVTRAMDHPWKGLEEIELKLGINSFDFHHITFRSCLQYGLATPGALVSWLEAERILLSCCHNDRYPCSNPFVMLFLSHRLCGTRRCAHWLCRTDCTAVDAAAVVVPRVGSRGAL